jgi:hypothetical protein
MIDSFFIALWTVLVFASIAWYAFLVFYLGVKGGIEIKRMIRALTKRDGGRQASPNG